MSAFVCTAQHIVAIVMYLDNPGEEGRSSMLRYCLPQDLKGKWDAEARRALKVADYAQKTAQLLHDENVRSYNYRYRDLLDAPEKPDKISVEKAYKGPAMIRDPLAILSLIDSLEYQSCETSDWEETPAYKILCKMRKFVVGELPGYDQVPWSI